MTKCLLFLLLLVVGCLGLPRTAHAADPVICSASISAINFGTIDPSTAGNVDVSADLTWSCTNNTRTDYNATACFNIGNGPLGLNGANRQIQGAGGNLDVQIYTDSSRTQVWGSVLTSPYTNPVGVNFPIGRRATVGNTIPVYARLFGNQTMVTTGTYSSTFSPPQVSITGELRTYGYGSCSNTSNGDAGNFSAMTMTASVRPACTVTATDLNFGSINGFLTGNHDSTSTISVTCVSGTAYKMGLDNGLNYAGSSRQMQGPGGSIAYALYRDTSRSLIWSNNPGTNVQSGTGNGNAQNLTVYGRVPLQTTPSAGSYQDTVTVNVFY